MGRSRGGLSTKIHLAVDEFGRARRLILGPGQQSDYAVTSELLSGLEAETLIADKGYDADWIINQSQQQCNVKNIVIPARDRGKAGPRRDYDKQLYKQRNKVERSFCRLKDWRKVLTRFEKKACNFLAFVQFAAAIINHSITVNTP